MTDVVPLENLLLLSFESGAKIDALWNIFIGIHVAILSILYVGQNPLSPYDVAAGIFVYLMFVYINYGALIISYDTLEKIRLEISNSNNTEFLLVKQAQQIDFSQRHIQVKISHVIGLFVIGYGLMRATKK